MGVVLFGTPGTDNELATAEGGYDYIETAWQLTTPTIDLLHYLRQRVQPGNNTADCILTIPTIPVASLCLYVCNFHILSCSFAFIFCVHFRALLDRDS